jgi:hypothetical protein
VPVCVCVCVCVCVFVIRRCESVANQPPPPSRVHTCYRKAQRGAERVSRQHDNHNDGNTDNAHDAHDAVSYVSANVRLTHEAADAGTHHSTANH